MKILLTNDDGINSDGIRILAEVLSSAHDVTVCAPDKERSCCSHSLTIYSKLTYKPYNKITGVKAYQFSGTPADCVKFGIDVIMKKEVDLVISGINNMPNLGTDIIYSGTVNGALEGAICGVKSIALSLLFTDVSGYRFVSNFIAEKLDKLYSILTKDTILNINFPDVSSTFFKGAVFSKLGVQMYNDEYKMKITPDGEHYILEGGRVENPENADDCDVTLFEKGYATVTPLHIQMTDFDMYNRLKGTAL